MLTARATCPDADQALDPLRDVGTGISIDALHGLYVLLCTRGRMHRLSCKWWIANKKSTLVVFCVESNLNTIMNVVHFYINNPARAPHS
ncbi:MAG: hypothetical protein ACI82I_001924 [Gammaproteobacteria bacterium]|jgi:hypothetical protein